MHKRYFRDFPVGIPAGICLMRQFPTKRSDFSISLCVKHLNNPKQESTNPWNPQSTIHNNHRESTAQSSQQLSISSLETIISSVHHICKERLKTTMTAQFKNINQMDYTMLLTRVNKTICLFNGSSDETEQAKLFILNVDHSSNSRKLFFDTIDSRLNKLLDPNGTLVDWFKSKKRVLEVVLGKLQSRRAADPDFLTKFSSQVVEGINCLEKLMNVDLEDLCSNHALDILQAKNSVMHMRDESTSSSSSSSGASKSLPAPPAHFEESFFYLFLHQVATKLSVHLRDVNKSVMKLEVELMAWHHNLRGWAAKYGKDGEGGSGSSSSATEPNSLLSSKSYQYRVRTVLVLLLELLRIGKAVRVSEALGMGPSSSDSGVKGAALNSHFPLSRLQVLLAVVSDMKAFEWTRLRSVLPAGTALIQETVSKKRKISVESGAEGAVSSSRSSKGVSGPVDGEEEDAEQRTFRVFNGLLTQDPSCRNTLDYAYPNLNLYCSNLQGVVRLSTA